MEQFDAIKPKAMVQYNPILKLTHIHIEHDIGDGKGKKWYPCLSHGETEESIKNRLISKGFEIIPFSITKN